MSSEPVKRRLAAILAADVAGYSRLMAIDDHMTVTALDVARRVFQSRIESNQGRVIDMAGDSVLAAFETAIGAVSAAQAIQGDLKAQIASVPEDRRMRFRIGIHLGDIIEKADGTVYGDGVNIAARLESLAEPGGVTVSELVRSAVRGKVAGMFDDQGEQMVKNIPDPVRAYRLRPEGAPSSPNPALAAVADLALPDIPSIAVLPFNNMSGSPDQEYFADGITEDIITDLSLVSGLFVIARNSSFVFKGRAVDIKEVGRKLGVRHVLEGSVRKVGERVRITAQLIDTQTGGHIWAERFDRDLSDIFAVQDEATRKIVDVLRVKLTANENSRRENRGKVNSEAYDLAAQGRRYLHQFTADGAMQGRVLLERALQIDGRFAQAYATLALTHFLEYVNGWNDATAQDLDSGIALAEKAIAADSDEAFAHQALAVCNLWQRNYETAERAARRCIELGPNFNEGFRALGQVLDFTGRYAEAVDAFEKALRLNPEVDVTMHLLGRAQLGMGRLTEAEQNFKRRLVYNPRSDMTRAYLASVYGKTGRLDLARETWAEILAINPKFSIDRLRSNLPYRNPVWFETIAGGLYTAGIGV